MDDNELTHKIIGAAYKVHNQLGSGFLEKVYENALRIELERQGIEAEQQVPISVYYLIILRLPVLIRAFC